MPAVSIVAGTLWGNRGAEAMVTAVAGRLRELSPSLHVHLFSYYPQEDAELARSTSWMTVHDARPLTLVSKLVPGAVLGGLLDRKAIAALSSSAALIDVAGVSFVEGREVFLLYNIATLLPALFRHVPVVKVGQALGGFGNPINRIAAQRFLPHCRKIFSRGGRTHQALVDILGNTALVERGTDVALLHQTGDSITKENADRVATTLSAWRNTEGKKVGLCPSSLLFGKSGEGEGKYGQALLKMAQRLVDNGYSLLLFPNATRETFAGYRNNDIPVVRYLMQNIRSPQGRVLAVDFDLNTDSIKALISECDVVVSSRFHAMIGSLALSKPNLVIGWSHKYQEVMADFGLAEWVVDYKAASVDLSKTVEALWEQREAVSAKISAALPEVRARATAQIDFLAQLVKAH
jgi:colanic acid/amylovoran biosynthesis protein